MVGGGKDRCQFRVSGADRPQSDCVTLPDRSSRSISERPLSTAEEIQNSNSRFLAENSVIYQSDTQLNVTCGGFSVTAGGCRVTFGGPNVTFGGRGSRSSADQRERANCEGI
jgi:hypothetical protein